MRSIRPALPLLGVIHTKVGTLVERNEMAMRMYGERDARFGARGMKRVARISAGLRARELWAAHWARVEAKKRELAEAAKAAA
jgi:hypothetical protein